VTSCLAVPSCFLCRAEVSQAHCSACYLHHADFSLGLSLDPEQGGDVPPKRRLIISITEDRTLQFYSYFPRRPRVGVSVIHAVT
jgi:hypothetical protein